MNISNLHPNNPHILLNPAALYIKIKINLRNLILSVISPYILPYLRELLSRIDKNFTPKSSNRYNAG